MFLLLLTYLAGVLTILSPCILPVLPFVFARVDRSFVHSGLPILLGMILTFGIFTSLTFVAGNWLVIANQYGRWIAIILMILFALSLIFPAIASKIMQPFVSMGNLLSNLETTNKQQFISSILIGIATGLLWTPCAGPILGLVLTGMIVQGYTIKSTFLLIAYASGAASSLALALLVGGKVFAGMKKSLGIGEWLRRLLGITILLGIIAIISGYDRLVLARISPVSTNKLEERLLDKYQTEIKKDKDINVQDVQSK